MTGTTRTSLIPTYRGTIYPQHLDHMGHMNVQHYVGLFDSAVWNLFSSLGITPAYLREEGRVMAAAEMHLAYRREVFAGDVIAVGSGLLRRGRSSLHIVQEMRDAAEDVVVAVQRAIAVHLDGESRRALALPPAIAEAAAGAVVTYPEEDLP